MPGNKDSIEEHYFESSKQWRSWLEANHSREKGVYLIFYKVDHEKSSMLWEEAVKVALCFGWIDSTVKSLGNGKRRQYFCPRKATSAWSKVNKEHVAELESKRLLHASGRRKIEEAKQNGSVSALDYVENGLVHEALESAFNKNMKAKQHFKKFSRTPRT